MTTEGTRIRKILRELAEERGPDKTFCPSEAARRLDAKDWRPWMVKVREAAAPDGRGGRTALHPAGPPR